MTSPSDETAAHLEQQRRLARALKLLRVAKEHMYRYVKLEDAAAITTLAEIETELLLE